MRKTPHATGCDSFERLSMIVLDQPLASAQRGMDRRARIKPAKQELCGYMPVSRETAATHSSGLITSPLTSLG